MPCLKRLEDAEQTRVAQEKALREATAVAEIATSAINSGLFAFVIAAAFPPMCHTFPRSPASAHSTADAEPAVMNEPGSAVT